MKIDCYKYETTDLKDKITGTFSEEGAVLVINGSRFLLTKVEAVGLARILWDQYGEISWT